MHEPVESPYLVPFEGKWKIGKHPTAPPKKRPSEQKLAEGLVEAVEELGELQRKLYASDDHAILLIFQAMDAAGKDSTIRAVLTGVDPTGVQVFSFKPPSAEENDHDFLWRSWRALPERGRIGVWNRSWYEEVTTVRVHPEFLQSQRIEIPKDLDDLWKHRLQSIADAERHLRRNGTIILKFFLHISRDVQRERLLARIDDPRKNWKFQPGDLAERHLWDAYMDAYEEAIRATSTKFAPWYAIPADDKAYMRYTVADIVVRTIQQLDPKYPKLGDEQLDQLAGLRRKLERDK